MEMPIWLEIDFYHDVLYGVFKILDHFPHPFIAPSARFFFNISVAQRKQITYFVKFIEKKTWKTI